VIHIRQRAYSFKVVEENEEDMGDTEDMEDGEMDARTYQENTKVRGPQERLRFIVAPTARWTTT